MAFSRRIEERRQRRESERRDRALDRRREDDRRHQEDERRREEAAAETRALELQLDADRERRLTRIVQARLARVGERRLVAGRTQQRQRVLDAILQARREAEQAAAAARLRREQLAEAHGLANAVGQDRDQGRHEDRGSDKGRTSRPLDATDKPKRPDRPESAHSRSARRRTPPADGKNRPDAPDERDTPSSSDSSPSMARSREEQRMRDERAATTQRREARRRERLAVSAEVARQQALRSQARQAQLTKRRESKHALEAMRAERDEAQRERVAQREDRETADRARRERIESSRAQRIQALRADASAEQAAPDRPPIPDPRPEPSAPRNPLTDRIVSGVLSGSLPWLTTKSNRVITITGEPVVLRGVSLIGVDGAGSAETLLDEAIAWGANVVRVAINRQWVLAGNDRWSASDYLREIDALVRHVAQAGAYTVLSLRVPEDTTTSHPDFDVISEWRLMAERYASEPAVLFDLFTAPRRPDADQPGSRRDWDVWTAWVQMTVAGVRLVHPRALCVVEGLDDGADVSGFPIPGSAGDPIPNLIYAAHLTPLRSAHWPAVRALARRHPVFVTEWGGSDIDVTWGERTAQVLRAEGIGWTAAHLNAEPALLHRVRDRLAPTRFGVVVQRAFALSARDAVSAPAAATP